MSDDQQRTQIERAIARALRPERRLSRRAFLRQAGRGGIYAGAALSLPSILAACGITGTQSPVASSAPVGGTPTGTLNWANWPLYIDTTNDDLEEATEAGQRESATLDAFTADTEIEVAYIEAIQDNQEFYGTIQPSLAAGQDTGWDMITITDWLVGKMVSLGYLEEIDVATSVPNFVANAGEKYKNPSYDPNNRHSVPWQSGVTGIGYNPTLTGREITSFADLLDPAFEGQIGMFTDTRDAISLALLHNGVVPKDSTEDDVRAAVEVLKEQAPLVRGYYGNEYADDLADGTLALTMAYSGDVFQLQFDDPNLQFVVPEKGGVLWIDNMCIPKGAQHPADALAMMDYVYNPEVMAQIEEYVNYICPVPAAQDVILQHAAEAETDEDREYLEAVANSPLVFPTEDMLARLHSYKVLSEEEETLWNELYQEVTLG